MIHEIVVELTTEELYSKLAESKANVIQLEAEIAKRERNERDINRMNRESQRLNDELTAAQRHYHSR